MMECVTLENGMNMHCLPLVPLRGTVMFPHTSMTFDVGREQSAKAIDAAMEKDKIIFLAAQQDPECAEPEFFQIYHVGTIARIKQVMKLPGGMVRVVAEGIVRGIAREAVSKTPYFSAVVEELPSLEEGNEVLRAAYLRRLKKTFEEYFSINRRMSPEEFLQVANLQNPDRLADTLAAHALPDPEIKQTVLETLDVYKRMEFVDLSMQREIQVLELERRIGEKVKAHMDENQREYYLREQLKVIEEELGDKDGLGAELAEYRQRIKKLRLKKDSTEKLMKEVDRLGKMPSNSAESGVMRTYLDAVLGLPWNKRTRETSDITNAQEILDEDHYGLEKVKERIVEYLSVRQFTKGAGSILCLVGPPGVGKTSIAKSIARALNRNYVRISLGGIHDEADIRGHRKTYIGAMQGRIMDAMTQAGSKNPLMLLDEIDKVGSDYRGDPQAALLEVLDSEQNVSFRDHYIEVPFDLSEVLFLTTANTLDTVSRPLLDRMEVIEISGYTRDEKLNIARKYLFPKAVRKTGLEKKKLTISDDALLDLIDYYTRESGVRNLEREIISLCRKAAKLFLTEDKKSIKITAKNLTTYLGRRRYGFDLMNVEDQIGVARGLAWTAVGGDTLSVEVNVMKGTGKTELTGKLGDVMKESALAAISYIRSQSDMLHISEDFYKNKDIHIHVPEGAVPKDGPSAGITMATAAVSALTGVPVRKDVAMTGEITLRGRVLPIGGLKEKSLAAYRAGIRTVIIPEENKKDLEDIPEKVRREMNFVPAGGMETVLKTALRRQPGI